MPYLVDGHNLIGKIPGLSLASIDDEMILVSWLQRFCLARQRELEVFFDNAPPGYAAKKKFGKVVAYFVRQGKTADQAIQQRILQLGGAARNYTVISSDRQVQTAGRAAGAAVVNAELFARELLRLGGEEVTPRRETGLSPDEVAAWEKEFRAAAQRRRKTGK